MPALSFTRAQSDDIPTIKEILDDGTQHKLRLGDTVWGGEAWTDQEVAERMAVSDTYLILADDEIVGTVAIQWQDDTNWGEQPPIAGYVHRLVIKDKFHGQNLSKQVFNWVAEQIAEHGREVVRLDCEAANERLCQYYESLGFKRVHTRQVTAFGDYVAALYERRV